MEIAIEDIKRQYKDEAYLKSVVSFFQLDPDQEIEILLPKPDPVDGRIFPVVEERPRYIALSDRLITALNWAEKEKSEAQTMTKTKAQKKLKQISCSAQKLVNDIGHPFPDEENNGSYREFNKILLPYISRHYSKTKEILKDADAMEPEDFEGLIQVEQEKCATWLQELVERLEFLQAATAAELEDRELYERANAKNLRSAVKNQGDRFLNSLIFDVRGIWQTVMGGNREIGSPRGSAEHPNFLNFVCKLLFWENLEAVSEREKLHGRIRTILS